MHWLEQHWYRIAPLHLVLWPLSVVFGALIVLRRMLYRAGMLGAVRMPVPVVVVGNITVGGTGKTPLVIWLARLLREHGLNPGVVCRGYGGSATRPQRIPADSDPQTVGDEAVLLARRCDCPVWIGATRVDAAHALLRAHPDCNVLISDDGLQHYALTRDVELAVIDGERGFGNGMLLPAGPLREPLSRLDRVDAVIINGAPLFPREILPHDVPAFDMQIRGSTFYNVLNSGERNGPERFSKRQVHAVAAIGNPQRFFDHLRQLGVSFTAHPFPDHHAFTAADIAFSEDEAVVMTEKDAVKCERFCNENCWALQIDAAVEPALSTLILGKIGRMHGS